MPDVGFDPRPRTGGDGRRGASPRRFGVSIRAPARGATVHDELHVVAWHVSIRAPARGATCYAEALDTRFGVSIRAPARGATTTFVINSDMNCVSIRAPARGATSAGADLRQFALFRSAPPHGGRLAGSPLSRCTSRFDPRPRTGGDAPTLGRNGFRAVSIRAPARGAT